MKPHVYHTSTQKRLLDVSLASLGLIVLSPVLLTVSVLILITAGRPILFIQKRIGWHNRPFSIYKFRTMWPGAHQNQWRFQAQNQAPAPMFKIYDDPRYVGVGKWLARTGLDEVPQLINILKGEMSVVGPRPLPIKEAAQLSSNWNFRHLVKPGIFSEWTISPVRHQSLTAWKELDQLTLSQGSLLSDLKLTFKTIKHTLSSLTKG